MQTLKIFKQFTEEMSGEKFTTAAKVIPIVTILKSKMDAERNHLAATLLDQLQTRFPATEMDEVWSSATFLDPCFKETAFTSKAALELRKETLANNFMPHETESRDEATEVMPEEDDNPWVAYDKERLKNIQTVDATNTEIERYIALPPLGRKTNPLVLVEKE